MGRNFLGCPRRAHDEVNVSHEFVVEHQCVPASEGRGEKAPLAAGSPAPGAPAPPARSRPSFPPRRTPGAPSHPGAARPARLASAQVHGAGGSRSVSRSPPPGRVRRGPALTSPAGWGGRTASWRFPSCCC